MKVWLTYNSIIKDTSVIKVWMRRKRDSVIFVNSHFNLYIELEMIDWFIGRKNAHSAQKNSIQCRVKPLVYKLNQFNNTKDSYLCDN